MKLGTMISVMWMGLMGVFAIGVINGCATPPTTSQVTAITNACAIDAGLRPVVTELLPMANATETSVITAARAVIDPICANPSAAPQTNAISAVTGAAAEIVNIVSQIKARQATTKAGHATAGPVGTT